jgi:hypothetical protein
MDSSRLTKLRQYYHSLLEQSNIFNRLSGGGHLIRGTSFVTLDYELTNLSKEYPDIVPPYDKDQYFDSINARNQEPSYDFLGIQTYLASVIGRLREIIDQPVGSPITEEKEFLFIENIDLRQIVQRDYIELQKAYIASCWKSVLLLSGGLIEAVLLDLLQLKQEDIKECRSKPDESDITKWDLNSLIRVSVELKLISDGVEKLSHPIREYRNLIHPGNELRKKLRYGPEEAKIAVEVVNILHRDLASQR